MEQLIRKIVREEIGKALQEVSPKALDDETYLSTAESAKFAKVTQGTIRLWIHDGRLPRHSAGRKLRVRRLDLETLMSLPPRLRRLNAQRRKLSPEAQAAKDYGL